MEMKDNQLQIELKEEIAEGTEDVFVPVRNFNDSKHFAVEFCCDTLNHFLMCVVAC